METHEFLRFFLSLASVYFVLANATYFVLLILSWLELRKRKLKLPAVNARMQSILSAKKPVKVSIVIPAFNEAKVIIESLSSYLSIRYPNFEVLVVDDGSTDEMSMILKQKFDLAPFSIERKGALSGAKILKTYRSIKDPRLFFIQQLNRGKAAALNTGVDFATGEICVTADADTIPERDCLLHFVTAFADPNHEVVAVGGTVRIANGAFYAEHQILQGHLPKSSLLTFQIIEYIRAFYCGRSGWEWVRSTVLLSGALAGFRLSALRQIKGFDESSITEDLEVVMNLRWRALANKKKWTIRLLHEPLCWTQAPTTIADLRRQRIRWQQGLAETGWKYFSLILNPTYGTAGALHLPYMLFFEWIGPWIELFTYVAVIASLTVGLLDPVTVGLLVLCGLLYSIAVSLVSIHLEESQFARHRSMATKKQFFWGAVFENIGYRQLTWLFRLEGMTRSLFKANSWGVQNRSSIEQVANKKDKRAA